MIPSFGEISLSANDDQMKRLLITLLASFALPTAVNAELTNDYILKANQSKKLISEGKFSEAITICDELIEISPDNQYGYDCKGWALFWTSKNKSKIKREAIKNFTKAIEINPENYGAYFFRGALQFSIKRNRNSELTACNDIKKAYLVNFPPALEYVKENESSLRKYCRGFY